MNWIELELDWLRRGGHCWFSISDKDAIAAFEAQLRSASMQFVKRPRTDDEAIVFEPLPVADTLAA